MGIHEHDVLAQQIVAIDQQDDHVTVQWSSGGRARFHYQWLRDNCRSTERFVASTCERKALTESIPADLGAASVLIDAGQLSIKWSDGGSDSRFDADWLCRNAYDPASALPKTSQETWGAEYAEALATFAYHDVMEDDAMAAAMIAAFERRGLIRLNGVPTVGGEVERFAERLAYVREIAFDRVANIKVTPTDSTIASLSSLPHRRRRSSPRISPRIDSPA